MSAVDLLRHLRYFVAVAEELHFGRAAARLHMAQPPLSQRIRGLERELGVRLFDRTSRRVELTPAGRLLLDEARGLLARADALTATMERLRGGELGELRAGVPPEIGASVLAELLTSFRAAGPDVRLELREATTGEQLEGLAAGELDVGVVRHPVRLGSLERGPSLAKDVGVLLAAHGAPDGEVELSALAGVGGWQPIALPETPARRIPRPASGLLA